MASRSIASSGLSTRRLTACTSGGRSSGVMHAGTPVLDHLAQQLVQLLGVARPGHPHQQSHGLGGAGELAAVAEPGEEDRHQQRQVLEVQPQRRHLDGAREQPQQLGEVLAAARRACRRVTATHSGVVRSGAGVLERRTRGRAAAGRRARPRAGSRRCRRRPAAPADRPAASRRRWRRRVRRGPRTGRPAGGAAGPPAAAASLPTPGSPSTASHSPDRKTRLHLLAGVQPRRTGADQARAAAPGQHAPGAGRAWPAGWSSTTCATTPEGWSPLPTGRQYIRALRRRAARP